MSGENAAEVLIVGAGPTGLSLGITLRRWGIPVRIIDRNAQPTSVSKALALWSASLEALQGMGVVDRFVAEGQRLNALCVGEGDRRLATLAIGEGIDSAFPFPLLLPQSRTEALLTERLAELGVSIERNVELVGLTQDDAGVTATLRHADGHDETVRTKYLAGCDGARSAVRQSLNITFEGYTEPQTFLLADVKIDGGNLDHRSIYLWWHNGGTVAMFPFGKEVWRIFSMRGEDSPKGDEPATLEEMQHCVDRFGPRGLRIHDPSWLSIFRINERLVTKYRVGRCFLAGDAAHIHSPAGGQGMNTGIQDAANLGWKLAAAVAGWGGEALLDSYQSERHPVGRSVLRSSGLLVRLALIRPRWGRAVRNAVTAVVLGIPPVGQRIAEVISGIGVRYAAPRGADRRVGTRAPDVPLRDGRSLYEALRGGRFVLLGARAAELDLPPAVDAAAQPGRDDDRLVLVRPDGYVGWVGTAAAFPVWASGYFRRAPLAPAPVSG
jgi:2-polyprenyl-6-methoxyphenol hydroxylase-like FAD-dependent oxidoreductase